MPPTVLSCPFYGVTPGQLAQRVAQLVGRTDDRVVDHLQRDAPGGNRRLPAGFEDTQGLHHAVTGLGRSVGNFV